MIDIFIGIDQSINSTGISIQVYDNKLRLEEKFFILTNKTTKKAKEISESLNNFEYLYYNKKEKSEAKNNNEFELFKLYNNIEISSIIISLIKQYIQKYANLSKVYIGMEGISYSSSLTKSLIDLSGLSYLIRYNIYLFFKNYKDNDGGLYIFTPGEIKKFTTGNGNANKDMMVNLFKNLFTELSKLPKIDDISDAYWICNYLKTTIYKNEENINNDNVL